MKKILQVFRIFGEINGGLLSRITDEMTFLLEGDDNSRAHLCPVLLIGSRGGSIEEAVNVYSFLKQLPQPLTTIAIGHVESAAMFIFLAGAKRLAVKTAQFMFHAGTYTVKDVPVNEMLRIGRESVEKQKAQIQILADEVGIPLSKARRWIRESISLSAQEAKTKGVVHRILEEPFVLHSEVRFMGKRIVV